MTTSSTSNHVHDAQDRLGKLLSAPLVERILADLPQHTGDVVTALNNAERWLECYQAEQGNLPELEGDLWWLLPVWASGSFLPRLMVRRPWLYDRLRESDYSESRKPVEVFEDELMHRIQPLTDADALASALREYKNEQIFSIGARDLANRIGLNDVVYELSALASGCLQAAYRFHRTDLARMYGEPLNSAGAPAGFTVLGMGKLGGWELNFSSDIDLIYLFEENGQTAGGASEAISNADFFTRLAKRITTAIHDVTDEGFVFRVDLRLRPEGNSGPLVNSVTAAESYYANWGLTWERAALLKARPVAGDLALGEAFLDDLSGIVYRRYLDYGTVDDIKLMKQKINVNLARKVQGAWDVKLGDGGIREIEFVVQTLQLIHAGKQKALRTRSTLEALIRLSDMDLLVPEDAVALADAYVFLRRLEHRLQIEHERQTQRLRDDSEAYLRMALLMGFGKLGRETAVDRFRQSLEQHRDAVQQVYHRLFEEPGEEISQAVNPTVLAVCSGDGHDEERVDALRTLGFEQPDQALETMRNLMHARYARKLDPKGRQYLERIMPTFLSECTHAPDPDMALKHLENFMSRVGGWSAYHSLLAENPGTLKLLVRLFGMSSFLSRFLIQRPELLDQLVLSTYATPRKSAEEMASELRAALVEAGEDDEEEMLDTLRRFKNTEILRVAMNDVQGQLDIIEVTGQLADLADVVLREAIQLALQYVARRYGEVPGAELVTLGMGKFGGSEMNYSSDLDLIFVYTGDGRSTGEKSLTLAEYFPKVVQRLITILTVSTREGTAYPIDTRLRPSGHAGSLVASLDSFEAYHRSRAAIWERQALIKARPIVGAESARHITEVLHHTVFERPLTAKDIQEIARVRERMEREIDPETPARYNVKTGKGGIIDIEFLVQVLQLKHGGEYHSLRTPNTFRALGEMLDLNILASSDYDVLREGFLFLRRLENGMRVLQDNARSILPRDPLAVEKLALSMRYERGPEKGEAGQALLAEFARVRDEVRGVYTKIFENLSSGKL